ncbi:beta-mannosidase [Paenibacillus sp. SORGH_AS306]|uniref:glycoside hydrolase family 2 protein n=1 Tax=unclassified Paenibacillus TaxID=185978 RepID=UPI002785F0AF|nr:MULTISPECIES: sugar-binding domain-containing protein [unclassified Paenibacillus]MDQ1234601.1 beta-mannosidase [Paenibacillus sp. SORGH_AS_0306]MDR6111646.1 beta-mannosidase [Paenibacillus sp. SORGH_AS_0338]
MNLKQARSLDEQDRQSFAATHTPWDAPAAKISVQPTTSSSNNMNDLLATYSVNPSYIKAPQQYLDGNWEMVQGGEAEQRIYQSWESVISVPVPGSIHQGLVQAGILDDPSFGEHAAQAKQYSHQTWWYRCTFDIEDIAVFASSRLIFEGVSPSCVVWLNGTRLGEHQGAFGGPIYDLGSLLQSTNTLIVQVHPAPLGNEWNIWESTVVFNCNYGWHYVNLPAVGIWRSVRIEAIPLVQIQHPFVQVNSTAQAKQGEIDLAFALASQQSAYKGVLYGEIVPDNFAGQSIKFQQSIQQDSYLSEPDHVSPYYTRNVHLQLTIPDAHLWSPLDMGEPYLYRLQLIFIPDSPAISEDSMIMHNPVLIDQQEITFGLRYIEMKPLPCGQQADMYNWTLTVNDRAVFIKGSGWCTLDALMDFSRERYDHFLSLTAQQHTNFLRAWGGGIPETDDFYDLCDRKGIMVMQEWPTCWGSHARQPQDVLEETVRLNTLRLRNHASLVMWCGGNETSTELDHPAIQMMGRYSIELDNTRPFHRTDPWGGSTHDHIVWNGWTPAYSFDYYANLGGIMLSEFGLASAPNLESVLRYMPAEEQQQWPPLPDKSFYHHLPAFDTRDELRILSEFADAFIICDRLEHFVIGTQLAQVTSLRHKMESARCHFPDEIGVVTYKLNDVYIGVSWATIDWYGVPKMSHYFTQDAYQPLLASVLFNKLNSPHEDQSLPVYVLDDQGVLDQSWSVGVRVYDQQLQVIQAENWQQEGTVPSVHLIGTIELQQAPLAESPLLIVSEIMQGNEVKCRTFYWLNFADRQGVLWNLPQTSLTVGQPQASKMSLLHSSVDFPYEIEVKNTGTLPAVGVELYNQSDDVEQSILVASDNFFWLDAGESRWIGVTDHRSLHVKAWNSYTGQAYSQSQ